VLISVPLGMLYHLTVGVGLMLGIALVPVLVGLPLLLAALLGAWSAARLERLVANRLLAARIPPLPRRTRAQAPLLRRLRDEATSIATWKVLTLLLTRLPVTLAAVVVAAVPIGLAIALLTLGVAGLGGGDEERYIGPWRLGPSTGALLLVLTVPAGIVSVAVLNGLGALLRGFARVLLSSPAPEGGAVREVLAQSLGDRSLAIAYWLPDHGAYVDEDGRPVPLPEPGSGRAWTAVEHDGRRVAALIHDEDLDAGPELVQAAAAAAALALANERLKAALRARVAELRASRIRIVEAGDAARRRLERDLHDGAQQHLVALALDLQLIRARVKDDDGTTRLVEGSIGKLTTALAELRELARGIHPAILSDRGLEPAIEVLATRTPLPVEVEVDVPEDLPPGVEAAAYFVVAEALTNVVKYAGATHATVRVQRVDDRLTVTVTDDGVGGADPSGGSGLRGLTDRLAALDGALEVSSPLGGGTTLMGTIPLPPGGLGGGTARPRRGVGAHATGTTTG
jgi:signal transduction histidine kinase